MSWCFIEAVLFNDYSPFAFPFFFCVGEWLSYRLVLSPQLLSRRMHQATVSLDIAGLLLNILVVADDCPFIVKASSYDARHWKQSELAAVVPNDIFADIASTPSPIHDVGG